MSNVFIIINEWTEGHDDSTLSEVSGNKYFTSEGEAWHALRDIAASFGVELDRDETSVQIESPEPHISYEEYYIQELTNGDED